jgi:hypothetical protein
MLRSSVAPNIHQCWLSCQPESPFADSVLAGAEIRFVLGDIDKNGTETSAMRQGGTHSAFSTTCAAKPDCCMPRSHSQVHQNLVHPIHPGLPPSTRRVVRSAVPIDIKIGHTITQGLCSSRP